MCSPLGVEPLVGGVLLNSTMEAGSIAAMEAVWLSNFLMDKGMVPSVQLAITVVIAERLQIRRDLVAIRQEST